MPMGSGCRSGRAVHVAERTNVRDPVPATATSADRGAVDPPRPPVPPDTSHLPPERGVVHEAGAVIAGLQSCRRCGLALPLPIGDGAFEVGGLIEHRRLADGERMTNVVARAPAFPPCDAPVGAVDQP